MIRLRSIFAAMLLCAGARAATLDQVRDHLKDQGIALAIAGPIRPVRAILGRTGLAAKIGPDRMFPTVAVAVEALAGDKAAVARQ